MSDKSTSFPKPKRTYEVQYPFADAPEYPITDEFARREMPKFTERRRHDNPKSGWNCEPTHASRSGMARFDRPGPVNRGAGKTIGSNEKGVSAANDMLYPSFQPEQKIKKEG